MRHVSVQQMSAFTDGALSGVSRELVSRHLAACASCREKHAAWKAADESLREALEWTPPERTLEEWSSRVELCITAERKGLPVPEFTPTLHPVIAPASSSAMLRMRELLEGARDAMRTNARGASAAAPAEPGLGRPLEPARDDDDGAPPHRDPEPSIEAGVVPEAEPASEPASEVDPAPHDEPVSGPVPVAEPLADSEPASAPVSEMDPAPHDEPASEPVPVAEPLADAEPASEPVSEVDPAPHDEPVSEPVSEPVPVAEPLADAEPASAPVSEMDPAPHDEPVSEAVPVAEPLADAEPASEPASEVDPAPHDEPVSEAVPVAEPLPNDEPASAPVSEMDPAPQAEPASAPVSEMDPAPQAEPVSAPERVADAARANEPAPEPALTSAASPAPAPDREPAPAGRTEQDPHFEDSESPEPPAVVPPAADHGDVKWAQPALASPRVSTAVVEPAPRLTRLDAPAPGPRVQPRSRHRRGSRRLLAACVVLLGVLLTSPFMPEVIRIPLPERWLPRLPRVEFVRANGRPVADRTASREPTIELAGRGAIVPELVPQEPLPAPAETSTHADSALTPAPVPEPAREPVPERAAAPAAPTAAVALAPQRGAEPAAVPARTVSRAATATTRRPAPEPRLVPDRPATVIPVRVETRVRLSDPSVRRPLEPEPDEQWPLLCGEILDTDGMPVEGALVHLVSPSLTVRTDRRGRFCVACPPGRRVLRVEASGLQTAERTVELSTGMVEKRITLTPAP